MILGGNTYQAYTPIIDVSFPTNGYALRVKLTDIAGSNTVHIETYVHYSGESSNTYHRKINADYTFTGFTAKLMNFGTTTTSIDKVYLVFTGGDGYATEFDYYIDVAEAIYAG